MSITCNVDADGYLYPPKRLPVQNLFDLPVASTMRFVLWLSSQQQQPTTGVSLTKELEYFSAYVELDEKETSARGDAFADIKDSIHGTFPNFGVGQFGSHPAGLSIFSSDIDLTVVRPVLFSGLETQWGGEVNCSLEETEEAAGCKRPSSPLIEREAKRIKTNPSDCDQVVTWALDTAAAPLNTMDEDCVVLLETNANDSNSEGAVTAELDAASMGSIEEGEVSDDDDDDESRGSDNSVGAHDLHEDARADKLNCLQDIYDLLRECDWVQRVEFRKFARVPIINLTHKSGVECDLSLDMSQQATSLVVRALLQRCGPALVKLSAFLKVFLNQLALDAPFTGGLGSYKLYVLLAKHIERNPSMVADFTHPELGPLLLSFLKYYGSRANLNGGTVVEVEGAEAVDFERTTKIGEIQAAFEKAHQVLFKRQMQRGLRKLGGSTVEGLDTSASASATTPTDAPADAGSNEVSCSLLASLLNTEHLSLYRRQCRTQCHQYAHRSEADRDAIAEGLLRHLNGQVGDLTGVPGHATLAGVKAANPALAARLRSFRTVQDGLGVLCGTDLSEEQEFAASAVLNMYADFLRDHSSLPAEDEDGEKDNEEVEDGEEVMGEEIVLSGNQTVSKVEAVEEEEETVFEVPWCQVQTDVVFPCVSPVTSEPAATPQAPPPSPPPSPPPLIRIAPPATVTSTSGPQPLILTIPSIAVARLSQSTFPPPSPLSVFLLQIAGVSVDGGAMTDINASSTLQQLCDTIPLLAVQHLVSGEGGILDPTSVWGKKIFAGCKPLPKGMCVDEASRRRLPHLVQLQLGPFRLLAVAERYVGKSFEELLLQELRSRAAVLELRRRFNAGLLVVPSVPEMSASSEMSIRLPLLKSLAKAGYIGVPPMRHPAPRFRVIDDSARLYAEETTFAEDAARKYILKSAAGKCDIPSLEAFLNSGPRRVHNNFPSPKEEKNAAKKAAKGAKRAAGVGVATVAAASSSRAVASPVWSGDVAPVFTFGTFPAPTPPYPAMSSGLGGAQSTGEAVRSSSPAHKPAETSPLRTAVVQAGGRSPDLKPLPPPLLVLSKTTVVTASSAAAAQSPVPLSQPLALPLPPSSARWRDVTLNELVLRVPFLAAQRQVRKVESVFDPTKTFAKKIIALKSPLHPSTFVPDENRKFLPQSILQQLGPFSTLAVAKKYVGKCYENLIAQERNCHQVIAEITRRFLCGEIVFQTGKSKIKEEKSNKAIFRSLVLAGIIPVPAGVDLSLSKAMIANQLAATVKVKATAAKYIASLAPGGGNSNISSQSRSRSGAIEANPAAHAATHSAGLVPNAAAHLSGADHSGTLSSPDEVDSSSASVFNPDSATGKAIIACTLPLPLDMFVSRQHATLLPNHLQEILCPFRDLRTAEKYKHTPPELLKQQLEAREASVADIRRRFLNGEIGNLCSTPKIRQSYLRKLVEMGLLDPVPGIPLSIGAMKNLMNMSNERAAVWRYIDMRRKVDMRAQEKDPDTEKDRTDEPAADCSVCIEPPPPPLSAAPAPVPAPMVPLPASVLARLSLSAFKPTPPAAPVPVRPSNPPPAGREIPAEKGIPAQMHELGRRARKRLKLSQLLSEKASAASTGEPVAVFDPFRPHMSAYSAVPGANAASIPVPPPALVPVQPSLPPPRSVWPSQPPSADRVIQAQVKIPAQLREPDKMGKRARKRQERVSQFLSAKASAAALNKNNSTGEPETATAASTGNPIRPLDERPQSVHGASVSAERLV